MSGFRVAEHEQTTPLWREMRAHYEARLADLRARNDARLSPDETAHLRGRIEEIKALLALANPQRKPVEL